jgi:hypothetical protein
MSVDAASRAMAARVNRNKNGLSHVKCYKCQQMGHYASNCKQTARQETEKRREGERCHRDQQQRKGGRPDEAASSEDEETGAAGSENEDREVEERELPTRKQRENAERVNVARRKQVAWSARSEDEEDSASNWVSPGRSYAVRSTWQTNWDEDEKSYNGRAMTKPEKNGRAMTKSEKMSGGQASRRAMSVM